jgi:hypothetical protein
MKTKENNSEHKLANRSGLLKAEISLPIANRMPDDHVIEYLDLENPRSFVEPASQAKISFARTLVSGRMIVYQDERVCRMGDNRAEYIPRIRQRLI